MNARNALRALLLCAAAFCAPLSSASDAPLKIGIVGTGNIGGALATHWAKAGHELVISSRHPEELKDLAKSLGPKVGRGRAQARHRRDLEGIPAGRAAGARVQCDQ